MLNCVWSETSLDADNRSHYGIATLVNNALDRAELGFVHRNGFAQLSADAAGAVVIVHGEHQARAFQRTVDDVNRLGWAVVIVIGDDAALFPLERFDRNRRKFWVQMAVPGRHDWADRKLICGFPHDAPAFLEHCKDLPRRYVWSFSGQVNHAWRRECLAQLQTMPDGFVMQTPGFWQGLDRAEYYKLLAESKFVVCPSGACTPDTLRVAEALEAGAIPVADDRFPPGYPRRAQPGYVTTGYWRYALGVEPPFPTLTNWAEFSGVLDEWSRDYELRRHNLQAWWQGYKKQMSRWLEDDVHELLG